MNELERIAQKHILGDPIPPSVFIEDHPKIDGKASTRKGRPVHTMHPHIRIRPRGGGLEKRDYVTRPLRDSDRDEYPEAWADYLRRKNSPRARPIGLLPSVTADIEADLHSLGIYSIEQAAKATEQEIQKFLLDGKDLHRTGDPEEDAQIMAIRDNARKGARSAMDDLADIFEQARQYDGKPVQRRAAQGVDESGRRGSVQGGPVRDNDAGRFVAPAEASYNFGSFRIG